MSYVTKNYLSTQFQNFAGKVSDKFARNNNATQTVSGLMSAFDKQKLDGIGGVGIEMVCLAWKNSSSVDLNYDVLSQYDFIYAQCSSDYTNEGKAFYSPIDFLMPTSFFYDFVDSDSEETVIYKSNYNNNVHINCQYFGSGVFRFATSDDYIGVWGMKFTGQSVTSIGGKALVIDSQSTVEETYIIKGCADADVCSVRIFCDAGSANLRICNYDIYDNGSRRTIYYSTACTSTYGSFVKNDSQNCFILTKKAAVKDFKVWMDSDKYTITKQ